MPFGYAAGQVLAQAVKDTNSLDPDQLAAYMHGHRFATVVGEIAYDENGEWSTPRPVFTQFQNVAEGDVGQFSDTKVQPIVWPPQYRTAHPGLSDDHWTRLAGSPDTAMKSTLGVVMEDMPTRRDWKLGL